MSDIDRTSDSIDKVLADYLIRVDKGEIVDKQALLDAHPELADKLQQFFRLVDGINHQALTDGQVQPIDPNETQLHSSELRGEIQRNAESDATVDHTPGRSRGLHIRCPHCSNGVELLADTPFEEITCRTCGSTFNLAVRDEQTSAATALQRVGRFELVSRLGLGGFGTVWKARDTELDRVVAVKIPRKGQLSSLELEQFFREARSAAQLRHPNIVPVYEVGKEGETIFIVCAFVRGVSLSDLLTSRRLDFREACLISQTIANALHHAHEHGIIHRDLKPSNVMLDQAQVPYLMDFGLAKRDVNEITMTVEGQILGTPAYMSPEQAMGHAHWTDRRSDIYSLGVMLFELLTGEKPFRGNAQMQVHQRLTEDAPDPRTLNRHIPKDLATICIKCMERDPNRRYSTSQQVAEEFERYLRGMPILARPVSRTEKFVRWCKRKPALATAAALTAILAIAGPTTAYRIETQRERLANLVDEKDDLIKQISTDNEKSVKDLSALQGELRLLKGEENPWKLWPDRRDVGPTKQLLMQVYQSHFKPLAKQLEGEQIAPLDQAYGHLALALLAEHVDEVDQARQHYELGMKLFDQVPASSMASSAALLAKAQCLSGYSRLAKNSDKKSADEALGTASQIFEKLNIASPDLALDVRKLDADMRRAVFAQPQVAKTLLVQSVMQINELVEQWPTAPQEFYNLLSKIVGTPTNAVSN